MQNAISAIDSSPRTDYKALAGISLNSSWSGLVFWVLFPLLGSAVLYAFTGEVSAFVAAAVAILYCVMFFPKLVVLFLPFLSAITGWVVEVGRTTVRLDQALSSVLIVPLVAGLVFGKIRWTHSRTSFFVFAYVGVNLVSSSLSDNPRYSIFQLMNICSSILVYFVVLAFVESRHELARFQRAVLVAGFVAMSYGLALFVLASLGVELGGVNLHENEIAFGIYGSMREPNIFGSYSASMLLIGLTFILLGGDAHGVTRSFIGFFTLVAVFALFLSYARAAWMGAFCGLLLLLMYSRLWKIRVLPLAGTILLLVAAISILFASGLIPLQHYIYKLQNPFNFEEGTGLYRAIDWVQAWANFLDKPLIGNGTFSYAYLNPGSATGEGSLGNPWISNLPLLVLHDTGLIGLTVFLGLLWAIISESNQVIRGVNGNEFCAEGLAYKSALIALLVAFLATSAFSYVYPWIVIGMIALSNKMQKNEQKHSSA